MLSTGIKTKRCLSLLVIVSSIVLLSACDNGDDGVSNTSSTTLPGTNIVGATLMPSTIKSTVGTKEQVQITYQTNQGNATSLKVTDLDKLPTYWTSQQQDFSCDKVTSDAGCVLSLSYTPLESQANKSFNLGFSYINSNNEAKTGNIQISYSSESGGSHVIYTIDPHGIINPAIGVTQSVNITFNTDKDGESSTQLKLTNLDNLPSDWTVNSPTFECDKVNSSGSGCLLNLNYTPTKVESGSIKLNYSYTNDNGLFNNSIVTLYYNVSNGNKVIATYPKTINLQFGERRQVEVSFATSDGDKATNLALDLTTIATKFLGWSANNTTFNCSNVLNGCSSLILTYAPETTITPYQGEMIIPYSYNDKKGDLKTNNINIWYQSSPNPVSDSVIVVSKPSGKIATTLSSLVAVKVNFSSTAKITNLLVNSGLTNLATINPGWSTSTPKFSCNEVSLTSPDCTLELYYNPTSLSDYGTVILSYSYLDNQGAKQDGTYTLDYQPQTHNYIIANLSTKSLEAIIGDVGIMNYSFTSSDGLAITNLKATITNDSVSNSSIIGATLDCSLVNSSAAICSNSFSYSPVTSESGNFTLRYNYINSANQAESAIEQISYTAKPSNKIKVRFQDPSGYSNQFIMDTPIDVAENVNAIFTTYDGNKVTDLVIDNTNLPSNITLDNTCSTIESNGDCIIEFTYHPTSAEAGKVNIAYSYTTSDNDKESALLALEYFSLPTWHKVASYNLTNSDLEGIDSLDMRNSSFSPIIFKDKKLLTFIVSLIPRSTHNGNLMTLQLQNGNLVKTNFESNITNSGAALRLDGNGVMYRAYNVGGYDNSQGNIVVQKFINNAWEYIGESMGVFSSMGFSRAPQADPVLAFDNNNNIYLTADLFADQTVPLSVVSYDNTLAAWLPVGHFTDINSAVSHYGDDLVIDSKNNIYASYTLGVNELFTLFKYNGSFWQKILMPDLQTTYSNILVDNKDNLYVNSFYHGNKGIAILKYNGKVWKDIGGDHSIFSTNINTSRLIADKQGNLYYAITANPDLIIYKYDAKSKHWSRFGSAKKVNTIFFSMAISPDQTKLYIVSFNVGNNQAKSIELDSYDLN